MSEQERIEAMVESGRITREQADRLLAVLAETEEAERTVDALTDDSQGNGHGAESHRLGAGEGQDRLDPGLQWLEIDTFAGNVDVKVVDGLTTAETSGGNLTATATGARLSQADDAGDGPRSFLDRLVDGLQYADIEARIPTGWGVHFDVKGGQVDIEGQVPSVKGHLRAGDLTIGDTRHVDVTVTAGEAEVGLRADRGDNRIRVRVGQADVRFLPGSSLDVTAAINVGDISGAGLAKSGQGVGAKASGHVGGGAGGEGGTLDVTVVTGDINFKVVDHE